MDRKYIEILENFIHKPVKIKETNKISNEEVQAICKILEEYKKKDEENNNLRLLYKKTAKKMMENGKNELADYFLAQINEVPTFVVDDEIDYYSEYHRLLKENLSLETINFNLIQEKMINEMVFRPLGNFYDNYNIIPTSLIRRKIIKLQEDEKISPPMKFYGVKVLSELLDTDGGEKDKS